MQPPSPEPSERTAPAVVMVPSALRSRPPPPLPPPLTSMPRVKLAAPCASRHTVPPPPSVPVPVAVTGAPMLIAAGAVSLLRLIAPPHPPDPPSAASCGLPSGPIVTDPVCASMEIVPPEPPASPARVALCPTAVIAPVPAALPTILPPASMLIEPPDPASPNPSAERKSSTPDGGTPRVTSASAVRSMEPPPNVPPTTLTLFSRSIDPPFAVSEMLPPPLLDEFEEVSARRPSPARPRRVMLPDAPFTRFPAVIMMFPPPVVAVRALAVTVRSSETSPSDWTMIVPPPAPLTSSGLARALEAGMRASPPLPSVSVIIPPGAPVPPMALRLPAASTVSLAARISNALDVPPKLPPSVT